MVPSHAIDSRGRTRSGFSASIINLGIGCIPEQTVRMSDAMSAHAGGTAFTPLTSYSDAF
ncbi:hypothetical protein ACWC2K_00695 [Streptomyces chattanoogensis]